MTNASEIVSENILVYGMGSVGKEFINSLIYLNSNVVGIAVTNCEQGCSVYNGLEIKGINKWKEHSECTVVIATSYRYHKEIRETCVVNGFNNIVELTPELFDEIILLCFEKLFSKHGISIQNDTLSIGGGEYINPYANKLPNTAGYLGQLGNFVIPSIYGDYSMVDEGMFELGEVSLKKGDIVLDLGANLGAFSVYAISRGCTPYALEPTPELIKIINRHIDLNNGKNKCYPYAVSNCSGLAQFYFDPFNCAGNSLFVRGEGKYDSIEVKQITVDEFVEQQKLERVDFIKADLTRANRQMLEGAQKTLKKFAPKLALAIYHFPDDKDKMTELILTANPKYKFEYKWTNLYAHI